MRRFSRTAILGAAAFTVLSACADNVSPRIVAKDPPAGVDIALCGPPEWVAFQDGEGPWTRAAAAPAALYASFHHTFSSTRGGIAIARQFASGLTTLSVLYGRPDELAIVSDTAGTLCGQAVLKKLVGTVAPLQANESARLNAGRFSPGDLVSSETGFNFELQDLTDGPHEILAARVPRSSASSTPIGVILRRTPALPDGTTLPVFDFNSDESFRPVPHTLTVSGDGIGSVSGFVGVRTAHDENILAFLAANLTGATTRYDAIPDGRLEPGDLQSLSLSAPPAGNVIRSAIAYSHSAISTIAFGASPSPADISVVSRAPSLRLRARFASQADYDQFTSVNYQQEQNTAVSVAMTSAYASLVGGYDLIVPDFSGVDGFDARWALRPTGQLIWTTSRIGGTLALGFNPVPRDGSTRRAGTDAGFITP